MGCAASLLLLLAVCSRAQVVRGRIPCAAGADAVVFCKAEGSGQPSDARQMPSGLSTGCLQSFDMRVADVRGQSMVLELTDAAEPKVDFRNDAVAWARAAAATSCVAEAEGLRATAGCRDRNFAPVLTDPFGNVTWLRCKTIHWLCGLGINIEEHCPATCGLCSEVPAEHFWGRLRAVGTYKEYTKTQGDAMKAKVTVRDQQWVKWADIEFLAKYLQRKLQVRAGKGLCHGTRSGREQLWFMDFMPTFEVWGTEIAEEGKRYPQTIAPFDFHHVPPGWEQQAAFVYSNALDHSYDPPLAILTWMRTLLPSGILIIDFSFPEDLLRFVTFYAVGGELGSSLLMKVQELVRMRLSAIE